MTATTTIREMPARTMRAGLLWASQQEAFARLAASNPATGMLVRRFVAGETLEEALAALRRLRARGLGTTVDVLGEAVHSRAAATAAADRYVALLQALTEADLDANVSLKLTQMGLDLEREFCAQNVARIVEAAASRGAFVRIDMEDHLRTDTTLAIARELHATYRAVGVVIQAYLRRSVDDVDALIKEGIRVRLCKGAYNEPVSVAFAAKEEVDANYLLLAQRLLREADYPALATHDETIIRRLCAFCEKEGIDRSRFEFQMLYGVRRDLQQRLRQDGYGVRVYVPFGTEWYPYFMRRLAERPANVLFLLRSVLREGGRPGRQRPTRPAA